MVAKPSGSITHIRPDSPSVMVSAPSISRCSPWLTPIAYWLGKRLVMPAYFRQITVTGQEHLPLKGPVILAPTHRGRWDPLILALLAGRPSTGRDLRYMVTEDEMQGIQGWFIRRLGGFAVNVRRPTIASLRHGIDLLHQGAMLVIFPEGGIFRDRHVHRLKPGLARLAVQASSLPPHPGIKVIPVSLHYDKPTIPWRCRVDVAFGPALEVSDYLATQASSECVKAAAKELTQDLTTAITHLVDAQTSPAIAS